MNHDSDPYFDQLCAERFPRKEKMSLTFAASYVGKLLVFDDSAGGRTPASTREQAMWSEILRLRSALAALVHGATRYDENPDSAVARAAFDEALAAAIRTLPLEEKT